MDPSGPALDLEVPLEIIIGTVPLRQVVEQYPPKPAVFDAPPQAGYGYGMFHGPPEGASAPYPPPMDASAPELQPSSPVMPPSSIPNLREWEYFEGSRPEWCITQTCYIVKIYHSGLEPLI